MALARLLFLTATATALSAPGVCATDYPVASQAAFDTLNSTDLEPGDRVLLQSGMTFTGSLNFEAEDSGTALDPIIITSSGTERATIAPGDGIGIRVYNAGGFVIRNLNLVGSGVAEDGTTTSTKPGISFFADSPGDIKFPLVHLDQLEVTGFGNRGVIVGGFNGATGYDDVRITKVVAHGNLRSGIETFGFTGVKNALTNVYVANCESYHNVGNSSFKAYGIALGGVDGAIIERCLAYDNGQNNSALGIWAFTSNDVTIQFNEAHSNKTSGSTGAVGFSLDVAVTNSRLQYNYSHDNDGAGFVLFSNDGTQGNIGNLVRYNISENDGRNTAISNASGLQVGGGVNGAKIYGNTVFMDGSGTNSSTAAAYVYGAAFDPDNPILANNILVTTGGLSLVRYQRNRRQSVVTFAGNNYWPSGGTFSIDFAGSTYGSLSAWRNGTGQEELGGQSTGSSLDPLLVDPGNGGTVGDADLLRFLAAYKLPCDSPLADQGLDLQSLFGIDPGPRDYFGVTLPQGGALDVGASECMSFHSWAVAMGLTPGVNDGFLDDPDGDGCPNGKEFALDGDPLSGRASGKVRAALADVSGTENLTLTIPVRLGAQFGGSPSMTASMDGVTYLLQGSYTLGSYEAVIEEISPTRSIGLPELSPGWQYRSFRLAADTATEPRAFVRTGIAPAAP